MKATKNIRPHRKCPCNSKKKYRNCCGKTNSVKFQDLPPETQKLFKELQIKQQIGSQYHTNHFGHASEIQSCIFNGRRMVCIGGSIVVSDDPDHDWNTPAQFLSSHLKTTLGNEWFEREINKPSDQQHILIKWCVESKIIGNEDNLDSTQFNGSALAYLHIAYDLFVLHNQNYLTTTLIERLKDKNNFNGARYELFALATMIRAGFNLKVHDERLGKGKVTECVATHIKIKTKLEVEAKARHVKGEQGASHGKKNNFDLYKKCLKPAMKKNVKYPYIIFVDINIPELDACNDQEKLSKIRKEYDKLQEQHPNKLPNFVCFTNIPFHYAKEDFSVNNSAYGLILSKSPRYKIKNEIEIMKILLYSLSKYAYLPKEFNESDKFVKKFLDNKK